ncbi:hypothetical protein CLFO_41240 [Clostridium formicaceticum]|jgi:hypothetical protein|uniref:Uncharacterized protein n=1 Tax=Clostridium formicaceticum TaxID=1497 RepID=A0AAC9RRF7_9CLOT|nr:hypothetical protein CLFO_41240 [Clostridium formicaceticum]
MWQGIIAKYEDFFGVKIEEIKAIIDNCLGSDQND